MRSYILCAFFAITLFKINSFAQAPVNQWEKAIVKIESIQQRYNFDQINVLLHQQIDTMKRLSQHETYSRQDDLIDLKDTIRGTGLLVADGNRVYLITAKHLIKATVKIGAGLETINDLISIKSTVKGKRSNDISLMNLASNNVHIRPFIFSDDQIDLGIISFQKNNYKAIIAYMKQMGCVPIPVQAIDKLVSLNPGEEVSTIGFPALPGKERYTPVVMNGKIIAADKTGADIALDLKVYPGNSGGPVIQGDKLIGILSYQTGIKNNIDAGLHPYNEAGTTTATKASYILPLLKKLQENEKNPAFNR